MAVLASALTTLENAKLICGVSGTAFDAQLTLLINRVSGAVRGYLDRQLTRSSYVETLPGTFRQLLLVREWPIVSIASVVVNGYTITSPQYYRLDPQDKASGMVYKEDGWNTVQLVTGMTADVVAASRDIVITYDAGYYLPADALYVEGSATSLPDEIQGVVDEMVMERFVRLKTKSNGLTSYSEGGISYGWQTHRDTVMMGISDEHAMVLNPFKRFVVA